MQYLHNGKWLPNGVKYGSVQDLTLFQASSKAETTASGSTSFSLNTLSKQSSKYEHDYIRTSLWWLARPDQHCSLRRWCRPPSLAVAYCDAEASEALLLSGISCVQPSLKTDKSCDEGEKPNSTATALRTFSDGRNAAYRCRRPSAISGATDVSHREPLFFSKSASSRILPANSPILSQN